MSGLLVCPGVHETSAGAPAGMLNLVKGGKDIK
jgi:hypothetical protein